MPDLNFEIEGAEAVTFAAAPLLHLKLRIKNSDADEAIQNVMLNCQIQIETLRRQYNESEKAKLFELYGEPERWGQTLKTLLWTHSSIVVRPFAGSTAVDLPITCTYDFNIAATKYFDGLEDGEVPLCLLFSGTVFYRDENDALQATQIPWEKEAKYRLSVSVWKKMMEHYYPNSAWLNIRKDVFERLRDYQVQNAISNWEQTFEKLLENKRQANFPINGHSATVDQKVIKSER